MEEKSVKKTSYPLPKKEQNSQEVTPSRKELVNDGTMLREFDPTPMLRVHLVHDMKMVIWK